MFLNVCFISFVSGHISFIDVGLITTVQNLIFICYETTFDLNYFSKAYNIFLLCCYNFYPPIVFLVKVYSEVPTWMCLLFQKYKFWPQVASFLFPKFSFLFLRLLSILLTFHFNKILRDFFFISYLKMFRS